PRKEAQKYMDLYFERYPGVLEYMERTRAQAKEQGYVETLEGRRLYLPDIKSSTNDLYLINVDSLYELEHIDAISRKLKKVANVCVRVEPNVPSATHAELVTAFHAKSGLDLEQAEETCRRILA
ncbi:diaminopimelate decarboxylase, partial [Salmonella enterica subsp. enterica serovar Heidelberg str. 622737-11]